jgi:3-dehydroquinate synthetase
MRVLYKSRREMVTTYCFSEDWAADLMAWYRREVTPGRWSRVSVVTDENVWDLYATKLRQALEGCGAEVVPFVLKPGDEGKTAGSVLHQIEAMAFHRLGRHDLLVCLGGGACCDVGGLIAMLYMRGLDYVCVPTSLMAQIDAAIGGKVGTDHANRKNLLGGFHHSLLVLIDSSFLHTLPDPYFRGALAEAVKIALITRDETLLQAFTSDRKRLLDREPAVLRSVQEACLRHKLALLGDDPFEKDLNRDLNLGHAVAHALEMSTDALSTGRPTHGEAVAIGLAAVSRYASRHGYCSQGECDSWTKILDELGLPTTARFGALEALRGGLNLVRDHRGGRLRLVIPKGAEGVIILPDADVNVLAACACGSGEDTDPS